MNDADSHGRLSTLAEETSASHVASASQDGSVAHEGYSEAEANTSGDDVKFEQQ